MILMADLKLLNKITVSYNVTNDAEEKLQAFLSASNEIKQYHIITE